MGAGFGSYPQVEVDGADVSGMDLEKPVDRLLPRHPLGDQRPQIGWNVQPANRMRRRPETVETAFILDLSLDGALIEATGSDEHTVDDVVTVRFGGVDGQAIIRHRHEVDDVVRFGIQWLGSAALQAVVEKAVEMVRGHNGELRARWEDDRR